MNQRQQAKEKSQSQGRDGQKRNQGQNFGAVFSEVIVEDEEEDNVYGAKNYQGMVNSGGNSNASS